VEVDHDGDDDNAGGDTSTGDVRGSSMGSCGNDNGLGVMGLTSSSVGRGKSLAMGEA
jgi:hypothetical protein